MRGLPHAEGTDPGHGSRCTAVAVAGAEAEYTLEWGNLYFHYGEGTLTHSSLPQQMYPLTAPEVPRGVVVGRERLLTLRAGVYG